MGSEPQYDPLAPVALFHEEYTIQKLRNAITSFLLKN
jgi:hypothetical protein